MLVKCFIPKLKLPFVETKLYGFHLVCHSHSSLCQNLGPSTPNGFDARPSKQIIPILNFNYFLFPKLPSNLFASLVLAYFDYKQAAVVLTASLVLTIFLQLLLQTIYCPTANIISEFLILVMIQQKLVSLV